MDPLDNFIHRGGEAFVTGSTPDTGARYVCMFERVLCVGKWMRACVYAVVRRVCVTGWKELVHYRTCKGMFVPGVLWGVLSHACVCMRMRGRKQTRCLYPPHPHEPVSENIQIHTIHAYSYIDLVLSIPAKVLSDDNGDRNEAAAVTAVLKSVLHSCKVCGD